MNEHPHHHALRSAVERADNNQSRFASDIGTSQQLVSYWLRKKRPLPGEFVLATERAGYGSRHELRPDLYPVEEAEFSTALEPNGVGSGGCDHDAGNTARAAVQQ